MLQPCVGEERRAEFILFLIIKSWAPWPHRFDLGSRGRGGGRTLVGVTAHFQLSQEAAYFTISSPWRCLRKEGASKETSRALGKSDLCLLGFESAEQHCLREQGISDHLGQWPSDYSVGPQVFRGVFRGKRKEDLEVIHGLKFALIYHTHIYTYIYVILDIHLAQA